MKTNLASICAWRDTWRRTLLVLGGAVLFGLQPGFGATFVNQTPISINTPGGPPGGSPYPSSITVSNLPGTITDVSVTLTNLSHSYPDDLDVLLVGPGGQRVLLLSDAGGDNALSFIRLTFSDNAANPPPNSNRISTGTYRPWNYAPVETALPAPAPVGPYGTNLSVFDGTNPNGLWRLYVADDVPTVGSGSMAGGWQLDLSVAVSPPVITNQPQNQTVQPGGTAVFQVGVSGTPPFGYQWRRNGQVIVPFGQGGPTLTIPNVQTTQGGFYSVMVSNAASPNGVLSADAYLNVLGPLIIVEPPPSAVVRPGATVRLRVAAAGNPPIRYQWTLNGMVLTNEMEDTLTLPQVEAKSGGNYQVVVWNDNEAITTQPALVRVLAATTNLSLSDKFGDRPQLQVLQGVLQGDNARAGTEAREPVLRGGGRTVWFEWLALDSGIVTLAARGSAFDTLLAVYTGTKVEDLTLVTKDDDRGGFYTSSLQFNAVRGTRYQIQLDGFGLDGAGGDFTVCWELERTQEMIPVILEEPAAVGVHPGGTATFRVLTDAQSVQYQWFFNGNSIQGATENVYMVSNAKSANVGFYRVRIMNQFRRVLFSETVNLQLGSFNFPIAQDKLEYVYFALANRAPGGGFSAAAGGSLGAGYMSIGLGILVANEFAFSNANHQTFDPNPCGGAFLGTLWQGLVATNTGPIQINTVGSEIAARLGIYHVTGGLSDLTAPPIACDLTSASNGLPCVAQFNAREGSNYLVVVEGFQAIGNIELNCLMGTAPPLTNALRYCFVSAGGSIQLSMPATNWFPLPACQWRFNGIDIPGATGPTLLVKEFGEGKVGTYSVWVSNFVGTTTRDVAYLVLAGPFVLNHWWTTNGADVGFVINASNSTPFVLQTTAPLSGPWLPIATNPDPCLILRYTNWGAMTETQRFFRATPWPPIGP